MVMSLWRRANARNVRLDNPYRQYTNLFIFRFAYFCVIFFKYQKKNRFAIRTCIQRWDTCTYCVEVRIVSTCWVRMNMSYYNYDRNSFGVFFSFLETLLPASGLQYLDILLNILKNLPQKGKCKSLLFAIFFLTLFLTSLLKIPPPPS